MSLSKLAVKARERLEGRTEDTDKTVRLVFTISYDLKDASSEYAQIIRAFEKLGYTRDSSAGEDTLPKNFYAGEKKISYDSNEISLKETIQKEAIDFKKNIQDVMDKEANGKLSKLFMSVSLKEATAFWVE